MSGTLREARIDAAALHRNAARSSAAAPVDLSADGYGLGGVTVAGIAREAGFTAGFAAGLDEALRLRASGCPLDLCTDVIPPWRSDEAREAEITLLAPAVVPVRDALYGFDGVAEATVRLSARVLSVKAIDTGDGVSYGYTFRAERAGRTALVAIGYGDGIHRHAGNRSEALLSGALRPLIGRVAMNVFVLWLGDDSASIGDEAVLFGDPRAEEPSVRSWADRLGEDPAVVTAVLGPRVVRSVR